VAVVGEEGGIHGVRWYWEEEKRISMGKGKEGDTVVEGKSWGLKR
jgi:hypothetical protein